ncbi:rod shape-determining protein RodA [Roseivirga sp. BDSF3-8]|uniref:rod shape-determining protein RodA n=1 Tax=Roseivirga sp. BDSF3-8 TaxID=3241598 RepID=UPI003531E269
MRREGNIFSNVDWVTVMIYFGLVIFGWLNIYAVEYNAEDVHKIFSLEMNSGKQLLFMAVALIAGIAIFIIDFKFYDHFAYGFYALVILLLVAVLGIGPVISGAKSWIRIGPFGLQPSEFAKFATALAVAKFISQRSMKFDRLDKDFLVLCGIILLPMALIVIQGDAGTALVFGSFVFVLYREGLTPWVLIAGFIGLALFILTLWVGPEYMYLAIGLLILLALGLFSKMKFWRIVGILAAGIVFFTVVFGVDFFVNDVLQPHQSARINVLFDPESDLQGAGYNVNQSKIAIGSGGMWGQGFLEGSQTKLSYVPEQHTDFIFCTIGEEHGWAGSFLLIALFITLLYRIIFISERQKDRFIRIYGYGVACILFFHFMINIGMTIGLFPVIGIPLPFFSYGGSSLLAFTTLLFILLKLDSHRKNAFSR